MPSDGEMPQSCAQNLRVALSDREASLEKAAASRDLVALLCSRKPRRARFADRGSFSARPIWRQQSKPHSDWTRAHLRVLAKLRFLMGSAPEAARDFLLPLPGIPTACGNGKWEVSQDLSELRSGRKMRTTGRPALAFHPFVRSAPSFRPDLRAARAGARSGGQGWPVFGPPRQRRAASLTAASTTACSIASGLRSLYATNKPSKGVRERLSKKELMLNLNMCAMRRERPRSTCWRRAIATSS